MRTLVRSGWMRTLLQKIRGLAIRRHGRVLRPAIRGSRRMTGQTQRAAALCNLILALGGDPDRVDPEKIDFSNPNWRKMLSNQGAAEFAATQIAIIAATEGLGSVSALGTAAPGTSIWEMNPFARGRVIEEAMGANLPSNFPTIDRFANGVATSIKSMDLGAATYQNAAALTRTVNGYVDSVASFGGRTWAGVTVDGSQVAARQLQLVVPRAGTAAQEAALNAAVERAQGMGVEVIVTHFP